MFPNVMRVSEILLVIPVIITKVLLELMQSSFYYPFFMMFCPIALKYLQFTFNYHFQTDDLLYKMIVLKEAKINTVCYNPQKKRNK